MQISYASSAVYIPLLQPETPAVPLCHPTCEPDVAALAKPLFDNTLSTGADDSGMHNNDSKSDLRSGYWSHAQCWQWQEVSRNGTAYSDQCLTLCDVSGFRKLFQNRNITITRILNESY